jgi:hypothetical protein
MSASQLHRIQDIVPFTPAGVELVAQTAANRGPLLPDHEHIRRRLLGIVPPEEVDRQTNAESVLMGGIKNFKDESIYRFSRYLGQAIVMGLADEKALALGVELQPANPNCLVFTGELFEFSWDTQRLANQLGSRVGMDVWSICGAYGNRIAPEGTRLTPRNLVENVLAGMITGCDRLAG